VIVVGKPAPELSGLTATAEPFELASRGPHSRSLLIEFHRGTW
jgi:hypothetical protein